jgi:hypothetical protein
MSLRKLGVNVSQFGGDERRQRRLWELSVVDRSKRWVEMVGREEEEGGRNSCWRCRSWCLSATAAFLVRAVHCVSKEAGMRDEGLYKITRGVCRCRNWYDGRFASEEKKNPGEVETGDLAGGRRLVDSEVVPAVHKRTLD